MSSTPIDWNQASALLGVQGEPVVEEMNQLFGDMTDYVRDGFDELLRDAHPNQLAMGKRAHQLRGSILNFGFAETAEILLKVEIEPQTPASTRELLLKAKDSFNGSVVVLQNAYPSLLRV